MYFSICIRASQESTLTNMLHAFANVTQRRIIEVDSPNPCNPFWKRDIFISNRLRLYVRAHVHVGNASDFSNDHSEDMFSR